MGKSKIDDLKKIANSIDCRINLFEGYFPKATSTSKGEILFWKHVVNYYGLFADCDRVQIKEKRNLFDMFCRYKLIDVAEYETIKRFWNDVSELRKWFCHNNNDSLFFYSDRKKKIEHYLANAFILSTNKPSELELIQQNDWNILVFNIESRFEEYLNILEKGLSGWDISEDKEDLIDEWIEIQSKALFSDKELIRNVLADIAKFDKMNQGITNISIVQLAINYEKQLESGGFTQLSIKNEMIAKPKEKRSNIDIIHDSIRNSGVI